MGSLTSGAGSTLGKHSYDVVVVGGGLAGMCAGLEAAERGSRTLIVEKTDTLGGSWNLSGGALWTARTYEDYRSVMPNGDQALGRLLTEKYEAAMSWLVERGVRLGPKEGALLDFGHGYRLVGTPGELVSALSSRYEEKGGEVLLGASVCGLLTGDSGIAGVMVRQGGRTTSVPSRSVILCSGGFGANPEMLTRYLGRWGDRLFPRCHAGNTGDGFQMALEIGAAASRSLANIYGHVIPAPPARVDSSLFRDVTFYGSIHAVVVNKLGQRFVDESIYDATTNQELAYQPEARGFLIFDGAAERHEREVAGTAKPGAPLPEKAELARKIGGLVEKVASVEEVGQLLTRWGAYGQGVVETISGYNDAAHAGTAGELRVPRRRYANPLETPPFYVVAVTASVTFTKGGLRTNAQCQVVDRQGEPIPGLYAAGADAGGLFYERYAGGGAWAVVSGTTASTGAAADAARVSQ